MMLGAKVLLPPTGATDCYVAKQLSQSCKHSESAEMPENQAFCLIFKHFAAILKIYYHLITQSAYQIPVLQTDSLSKSHFGPLCDGAGIFGYFLRVRTSILRSFSDLEIVLCSGAFLVDVRTVHRNVAAECLSSCREEEFITFSGMETGHFIRPRPE